MEKKQKGEQFRILDPPRMAEKPISPNLKMILMGCIAGRAGHRLRHYFPVRFFDNSVRKPQRPFRPGSPCRS